MMAKSCKSMIGLKPRFDRCVGGIAKYLLFLTGVGGWFSRMEEKDGQTRVRFLPRQWLVWQL